MQQNTIIAFVINSVLFISLFCLTYILSHSDTPPLAYNQGRFIALAITHVIAIFMVVRLVMIRSLYEYVAWAFQLSLIISILCTIVEVYNVFSFGIYHNVKKNSMGAGKLTYLNLYFLIYMYSLITSFVTGLFVCCTNIMLKIHKQRVRRAIQQSIRIVDYDEKMADIECSICLAEFYLNDQIMQIKCKHIFHGECLSEWIKLNQTCPTCRFNIFEGLQEEEDEN